MNEEDRDKLNKDAKRLESEIETKSEADAALVKVMCNLLTEKSAPLIGFVKHAYNIDKNIGISTYATTISATLIDITDDVNEALNVLNTITENVRKSLEAIDKTVNKT